ncbi:MauE/DoxX family redox-associated membrane protein [Lysinibacillus sp. NPDC093190]|uniref:MauE/DoxX family redox-associated membrane protein n=1 Tax=Lysinibacillus sp. NPDC093190 TaxID=3390575 RepID=UPI003CFE0F08
MHYFTLVINLTIYCVFISSFYMKIQSIFSTSCEIYSYNILKNRYLVKLSSYILLLTEFVISLCFAFNLFGFKKNIFCAFLLIFFCIILLKKRKQEKNTKSSCGCFGDMEFMNKYPLFRNFVLLALLIIQFFLPNYDLTFRLQIVLFLIIFILIIFYNLLIQIKKLKVNYI